jgi:predicted dehydrogenase
LLDHESGAHSEASMSATVPLQPHRAGLEVYGSNGVLELDCVKAVGVAAFATLRAEFAEAVRTGKPHPLDVRRGLHLQRILDGAERQLL